MAAQTVAEGRLEPSWPRTQPSPLARCVARGRPLSSLCLSLLTCPLVVAMPVSTLLGTERTIMFMLAMACFAVSSA